MEVIPGADLRFLVAEDHAIQRRLIVKTLQNLGATTILEAEDGQAALAILGDPYQEVDVVVTDLDMPGMDGMEFLRRLGQADSHVAIILASALERSLLASIATMAQVYGVRLLGVLEKPVTLSKLLPLLALHRPSTPRSAAPVAACSAFTQHHIAQALRDDEFEPFFQPKISLATGRVAGAEALARWRHAQRGTVGPADFIGCMEEHGLIDELSWAMLRKAAALGAEWRNDGIDGTVAVNLSVHSLRDPTTADRVTRLVRSQRLEPRFMMIEVTESAAAGEMGEALENLARLRMNGFGLSIDDYGTGYSSMQQLTRIAFTELKIDQSFVRAAAKENAARSILESSIRLAKELRLTSVAEGVETLEECALLQRLGCDLAQGYFFARPMPADQYPHWIRNWDFSETAASLSL